MNAYSDTAHDFSSPWIVDASMDWRSLVADRTPVLFRKYSHILTQSMVSGNAYIVKTGRVNLSIVSSNGKEKALYIAGAGTIFAEESCFYPCGYTPQATANYDCELYVIPYAELIEIVRKDPSISLNLLHIMAQKLNILTAQIDSLLFSQTRQRVCNVLLQLGTQFGEKLPDGSIYITMTFTHQIVANLVGSTRATVTNVFLELLNESIICKQQRHFIILDMERLRQFAESNPSDL